MDPLQLSFPYSSNLLHLRAIAQTQKRVSSPFELWIILTSDSRGDGVDGNFRTFKSSNFKNIFPSLVPDCKFVLSMVMVYSCTFRLKSWNNTNATIEKRTTSNSRNQCACWWEYRNIKTSGLANWCFLTYLNHIRRRPQLFTSAWINLASLNISRTWEVSLPPDVFSLRRFNIVLTWRPLPLGGCPTEFLRTVTFPHAPRWPFTTQSASRHCSMHVRDGHRTVVTSDPSRPFTFGVFKLSCTCTGGTKYLMLRFAAEQAHHASRRYCSEDNWGGLAMW